MNGVPAKRNLPDDCRNRDARIVRVLGVAGALACMLAYAPAGAQDMIDPTRPPALVDTNAGADANGLGLQSVLISDTRKAAIIGGQLVELGQKYGDATLVRVAESEVTLTKGRETQVLHLFPGVEKKMVTAAPNPAVPATPRKKTRIRGKDK